MKKRKSTADELEQERRNILREREYWKSVCERGHLMDIENLIERLKECSTYGFKQEICGEATDALSTLQAENVKLRAELEKVKAKRYTAHEVAVLLAEAIGDDCACNVNGNDEWLPETCELQDACPNPDGVACWEQWLKWRKKEE